MLPGTKLRFDVTVASMKPISSIPFEYLFRVDVGAVIAEKFTGLEFQIGHQRGRIEKDIAGNFYRLNVIDRPFDNGKDNFYGCFVGRYFRHCRHLCIEMTVLLIHVLKLDDILVYFLFIVIALENKPFPRRCLDDIVKLA